uniref:purine-nucleoside phosphorylase n=1 Tax=Timema bartmani TaxID=61472 RepID=A0A7R9F899_9NEOP|nr:unnamed protein product [Timema bartmani]
MRRLSFERTLAASPKLVIGTVVALLRRADDYTHDVLEKIANYLKGKTSLRPTIGIICGSGISPLADTLDQKQNFPYHSIPDFPLSTVPGHVGQLVFGLLEGVPVLCMQGRFHYYEGYPIWKCAMPVRVMKLVGITHMIVTNAAGGLGDGYKVGDVMIIKDHVNFLGLAGVNPLRGPNDDKFGIRFPAMNKAYDEDLRNDAKRIAKELDIDTHVHEGVYACVGGPSYETIAELRMMKMMGINAIGSSVELRVMKMVGITPSVSLSLYRVIGRAEGDEDGENNPVGMSTVHEVILAKHCNLTVLFVVSLITNECVIDYSSMTEACHEDVIQSGQKRGEMLRRYVAGIVRHIADKITPETLD